MVTAVRNNQGNTIQGGQGQDTFIDLTLDTGVVLESGDQVQERLNDVNRSKRPKQNRDGNCNFPETPEVSHVKSVEQVFGDQADLNDLDNVPLAMRKKLLQRARYEHTSVTLPGADADAADIVSKRKKPRLSRDRKVIAEGEWHRNHFSQSARRVEGREKGFFEGADLKADYIFGKTEEGRELISCSYCSFFLAGCQVLHSQVKEAAIRKIRDILKFFFLGGGGGSLI